jgi:hypothetical protein
MKEGLFTLYDYFCFHIKKVTPRYVTLLVTVRPSLNIIDYRNPLVSLRLFSLRFGGPGSLNPPKKKKVGKEGAGREGIN